MSDNATEVIERNAKVLEDLFFSKLNADKIEALRQSRNQSDARLALRNVLPIGRGVEEAELNSVLDDLLAVGITAETVTALQLIPLVSVAWSDDDLSVEERDLLLKIAAENDVTVSSFASELLEEWLTEKPGPELLESFKAFVSVYKLDASPESVHHMRTICLEKAEAVAAASGGFLGFGATNRFEQGVLQSLKLLF